MNLPRLLKKSLSIHQSTVRHASFMKSFKNFVKVEKYEPPYVHIIQIGDPILRTVSDPVPVDLITSNEVKFLLNRLEQVRQNYGLVGIAAPQIGINLRILLASFEKEVLKKFTPEVQKTKEMSLMPLTVFINPEIKILDHRKVIFEESCASVTGYAADVPRPYAIEVKSFDEKGREKTEQFSGWNARIVQHEFDHLNGHLFTDFMDRKTLRCTNWEIVNRKAGKIEIPFYPKSVFD